MIDWPTILRQHRIEFIEAGKNIGRGHIGVKCPFCGTADPSHHMSISLNGRGWHCWRNTRHSGSNPAWLLAALLRISQEEAKAILGPAFTPVPVNHFAQSVIDKIKPPEVPEPPPILLPEEFRNFAERPSVRPFLFYLHQRGFDPQPMARWTDAYQMYYAARGKFHGRILFTVTEEDKLVGWTGRTINPYEPIRYRTHGRLSQHLLWQDKLLGHSQPDILLLVEGPFDALKIWALGADRGILATCFFTAAPSQIQIGKLYQIRQRFRRCYLVLDQGAVASIISTGHLLRGLEIQSLWLPKQLKDPGELDLAGLARLVEGR